MISSANAVISALPMTAFAEEIVPEAFDEVSEEVSEEVFKESVEMSGLAEETYSAQASIHSAVNGMALISKKDSTLSEGITQTEYEVYDKNGTRVEYFVGVTDYQICTEVMPKAGAVGMPLASGNATWHKHSAVTLPEKPATGHKYELVEGVLKCSNEGCDVTFTDTWTDGKEYVDGLCQADGWNGNSYYVDGQKLTGGWQLIDNDWHYFTGGYLRSGSCDRGSQ